MWRIANSGEIGNSPHTGCGARFPCSSRTGEQEDLRFALHSKSDIRNLDLINFIRSLLKKMVRLEFLRKSERPCIA